MSMTREEIEKKTEKTFELVCDCLSLHPTTFPDYPRIKHIIQDAFSDLRKNIEILEMELKVFRKENEELKKSLQFMIKHVADLRKENEKLKGKSMTREDELKDRIVAIIESSLCEFVREAKFIDGIMDEINLYTSDLRKENENLKNANGYALSQWAKATERIQELEKGINDTINNHRKKVMLTCEEGCWCWGLSKLTGGE